MFISNLEQLPKLCENYGCKEIAFGMNHELFCKYRDIACKIGEFENCASKGLVKDLKTLDERDHSVYRICLEFQKAAD